MSEDKPVERPVDLTHDEIKAREADVAADVAKRNAGNAPKSAPAPSQAENDHLALEARKRALADQEAHEEIPAPRGAKSMSAPLSKGK